MNIVLHGRKAVITAAGAGSFQAIDVLFNCVGCVPNGSLLDCAEDDWADPAQALRDFMQRQPMGRLGKAEEIAALALYLGSDLSAYTTGAEHIIDGGWSSA
jgi:2-keto-3-deoxy-L-fuconate dehydrogenase